MEALYWIGWIVFLSVGMFFASGGRRTVAQFFRLRREREEFERGCAQALLEAGLVPASAGMVEDLLRALSFKHDWARDGDILYGSGMIVKRKPRRYIFRTRDRWDIRYMLPGVNVCNTVIVCNKGEARAALMEAAAILGNKWLPYALGKEGANPLNPIALRWYELRRFLRRFVKVSGWQTHHHSTGGWCFQVIPCVWIDRSTHGDDVFTLGASWAVWGGVIKYTRPAYMADRIMTTLR